MQVLRAPHAILFLFIHDGACRTVHVVLRTVLLFNLFSSEVSSTVFGLFHFISSDQELAIYYFG